MALNTSQVSYYMTQRKKGATQHISAMKAGISVRSGRRIEKDQWSKCTGQAKLDTFLKDSCSYRTGDIPPFEV
ncbi:hypothetical protein GFE35_21435 [Salmonella enterica]|nr:hypothetical protein [Salmonella enterica]EMA3692458.1 hypothetical protein [Salmonella enterica]